MSDLRVESADLHAQFASLIPGAPLPWSTDADDAPGCIYDATGAPVATVDPWGDIDDAQAIAIAAAIVLAVNTCAGFRASADAP